MYVSQIVFSVMTDLVFPVQRRFSQYVDLQYGGEFPDHHQIQQWCASPSFFISGVFKSTFEAKAGKQLWLNGQLSIKNEQNFYFKHKCLIFIWRVSLWGILPFCTVFRLSTNFFHLFHLIILKPTSGAAVVQWQSVYISSERLGVRSTATEWVKLSAFTQLHYCVNAHKQTNK